ncbi:MAG TPA: four helix bundle protein [Micropepsaceae bacterium]|nr:four helix bundle protein [Micropepsaceae bacterium]
MSDQAINSYQDLRIWQESMSLAEACYRLTRDFPKEESFGLTSQIRRSAASIPANIAEGHGREHTRSFVQYLRISQGSLKELETHLLLSERVGVVSRMATAAPLEQCQSIGKMLRALIRTLQQRGEQD